MGVDFGLQSSANVNVIDVEECSESPLNEVDECESAQNKNDDEYDFSNAFISEEDYNNIMKHNLEIEKVPPKSSSNVQGNRIVEINYILNATLSCQYKHSQRCTTGLLEVFSEERTNCGLTSRILMKCNMCDFETSVLTANPESVRQTNVASVWGTLATGSTYEHSKERLSALNIPYMPYNQFHAIEEKLHDVWYDQLCQSMENAGKEELECAKENGQVDTDGNFWITVYLDGGWSHRSYGHNYNAASGVAVIIGRATGKLIYLGVRNKYCCICARAANKEIEAPEHRCFKNWTQSSSAMEADIIVQGFKDSMTMHGVQYHEFIADGDSSVFHRIRSEVPYGHKVKKIECLNHVVKNYGQRLYKIKADTTIEANARKCLTVEKIKQLEKIAMNVVYIHECGDLEQLKKSLENGPYHVYGDHSNCDLSYCSTVGDVSESKIAEMKSNGIFYYINRALDLLISKGHLIINNETNNRAELYMSILARFNAGKRLNLTTRGSFETRAYAAGLRYNCGVFWHQKAWKSMFSSEPGHYFKAYMEKHNAQQESSQKRKLISKDVPKTRKVKTTAKLPNVDYGTDAFVVEMSPQQFDLEKNRVLQRLQVCYILFSFYVARYRIIFFLWEKQTCLQVSIFLRVNTIQ